MEKVRYMISDAAALAGVETHVLRYWEEELDLTIPRNEMGHRYYTRENIQEFQKIKELKEKGYQLKAIRMILHNKNPKDADLLRNRKVNTKKRQNRHLPELAFLILGTYFTAPMGKQVIPCLIRFPCLLFPGGLFSLFLFSLSSQKAYAFFAVSHGFQHSTGGNVLPSYHFVPG